MSIGIDSIDYQFGFNAGYARAKAEVKHGRWKAWDLTWGRSIYVCTSCGDAMEVPTENGKLIFNYCPNCGARMDLDEVTE